MNDLTPEQSARVLELYRLYHYLRSGHESEVTGVSDMLPKTVRAWLAVEAHVLASHACPDVESDARVQAWNTIAQHPFFAKLDAAHAHTCEPVWRPVSLDEIQAGWEVRARRRNGSEAMWGAAHCRDDDGDWRTESDTLLTYDLAGWTYETTAPAVAPKPDPRVAVVLEWADDQGDDINAESLLARLDAITGGEQ